MGPESGGSLRPKHASPETAPPEPAPAVERRRVRVRVQVRSKRRRRWYRRKILRRRVLFLVGFLALFLGVDGAWAATGIVRGLQEARTRLQDGAQALLGGELERAREAFLVARRGAEGAGGALQHPAVWVADILPGLGDDVDALQALAASATEVAVAGGRLVDAAEASGWDGSSIPGVEGTTLKASKGGRSGPKGKEQDPTDQEQGGREGRGTGRQGRGEAETGGTGRQGRGEAETGRTGGRDRGDHGTGGDRGDHGTGGDGPRGPREGKAVEGLQVGIDVDLDVLRLAAPHLRAAAAAISRAQSYLGDAQDEALWYPVSQALAEAQGEVGSRAELIRRIADLSELLPGFLGGSEPRRYFLAFQNLSAPRGSGGFLGVYGILAAEDGDIELERISTIRELERARKDVEAPIGFLQRYSRFGAARVAFAANYSPHFPTTGPVLLDLYQASEGQDLDGVIAVDPLWAAYALEASGPISTDAWPEKITAQNASRILHKDVFLLDREDGDATQIAVGQALIEGLLGRPLDPRMLVEGIARAARERHLQVYADRDGEQALLGTLGVAGSFEPGPNPTAVVWQDATNNKAGYFAHKEVHHRVELRPDGSAAVSTRITLHNRAPGGPPSVLLGYGKSGDPPGTYAAYVNVYLPRGATEIRSKVSDFPGLGSVEQEFGRPVVFELLLAPSGESIHLDVQYVVPGAVEDVGDAFVYRADVVPQPALRPESVTVDIDLPSGTGVEEAAPGMAEDGQTIRFEGQPSAPRQLWVRYRFLD